MRIRAKRIEGGEKGKEKPVREGLNRNEEFKGHVIKYYGYSDRRNAATETFRYNNINLRLLATKADDELICRPDDEPIPDPITCLYDQ